MPFSLGTSSGSKETILLEELLESSVAEVEYGASPIRVFNDNQLSRGFVAANPSTKIPAPIDYSWALKIDDRAAMKRGAHHQQGNRSVA